MGAPAKSLFAGADDRRQRTEDPRETKIRFHVEKSTNYVIAGIGAADLVPVEILLRRALRAPVKQQRV